MPEQQPRPCATRGSRSTSPSRRPVAHSRTEKFLSAPCDEPAGPLWHTRAQPRLGEIADTPGTGLPRVRSNGVTPHDTAHGGEPTGEPRSVPLAAVVRCGRSGRHVAVECHQSHTCGCRVRAGGRCSHSPLCRRPTAHHRLDRRPRVGRLHAVHGSGVRRDDQGSKDHRSSPLPPHGLLGRGRHARIPGPVAGRHPAARLHLPGLLRAPFRAEVRRPGNGGSSEFSHSAQHPSESCSDAVVGDHGRSGGGLRLPVPFRDPPAPSGARPESKYRGISHPCSDGPRSAGRISRGPGPSLDETAFPKHRAVASQCEDDRESARFPRLSPRAAPGRAGSIGPGHPQGRSVHRNDVPGYRGRAGWADPRRCEEPRRTGNSGSGCVVA